VPLPLVNGNTIIEIGGQCADCHHVVIGSATGPPAAIAGRDAVDEIVALIAGRLQFDHLRPHCLDAVSVDFVWRRRAVMLQEAQAYRRIIGRERGPEGLCRFHIGCSRVCSCPERCHFFGSERHCLPGILRPGVVGYSVVIEWHVNLLSRPRGRIRRRARAQIYVAAGAYEMQTKVNARRVRVAQEPQVLAVPQVGVTERRLQHAVLHLEAV
jgi:hypothetical protein